MTTPQAGDILLVRDYTGGSDLLGNLILAGQRARYGNVDAARWTHSALVINSSGDIVEALAQGVVRDNLSKYNGREALIISYPATPETRALIVQGALEDVGLEYNVIDFISLAFKLLFKRNWGITDGVADICSELVSRYSEKAIPRYPRKPPDMMPADLGTYHNALSGDPLPSISFLGHALDVFRHVVWALNPFTKGLRP